MSGKLQARLALPAEIGGKPTSEFVSQNTLRFYPGEWGTLAHNAAQGFKLDGQQLTIELVPGETPPAQGSQVCGVLVAEEKTSPGGHGAIVHALELGAGQAVPKSEKAASRVPASGEDNITLWRALLLAFAGGIVLNLMPCVFPVLSLKALGLLKHTELSSAQKRMQGVAYTAGVLASFSLLAVVLFVIKNLGAQVGWGFQFQSPYFVLGVAYLIFVVGSACPVCLRWAAPRIWVQAWPAVAATAAVSSRAYWRPLSPPHARRRS
jgi:hypothetical protein